MNDGPASSDGQHQDGDPCNDVALVERARAGDRAALESLLRRHHDRILAVCHRMCRNRADAEDAAQEALIAIVRGIGRFDSRSRFSTWAYRVTTNCCLDELRRQRRRPDPVDIDDTPEIEAREPGPEVLVEGREQRRMLAGLLDDLPEEFRIPLVLRDVADLDYASIGEILGLPPGTVRSRIARARSRLACRLADGNLDGTRDVTLPEHP